MPYWEFVAVQLLRIQDIFITSDHRLFRNSPLPSLIAGLTSTALTVGAVLWYLSGGLPLLVLVLCGSLLAFIAVLSLLVFKKALAPANWLLAISPSGVLLKFRSYLNANLAPDVPQVLSLRFSELESASIARHTLRYLSSRNRTTVERRIYLELALVCDGLDRIREVLRCERNLEAATSCGPVKTRSKFRHYPVSLTDADTLRIEWRSSRSRVVPHVRKAVDLLSRNNVTVKSQQRRSRDYTNPASLTKPEQEAMLLELAENGRTVAATRLARKLYNCDTARARQFVDSLLQ